jgi:glycosyltransferase involved in cell wall biosynthesis
MISIVINSLGRGGAERSVLILLEELRGKGVSAELILLRNTEVQYDLPQSLAPHVVSLGAASYAHAAWKLLGYYRTRKPSVIYAMMPQASLIAVATAALIGVRAVTSERTTPVLFYRNPIKRDLALAPHALASQTIFISRYALENGIPRSALARRISSHAVVLHNPVPVETPPARSGGERLVRARRIEQALASDRAPPLRILLATRLAPGKGVRNFLVEAGPWIKQANARLVIAGAGPLEASVRALALSLGLGDKVQMPGFMDNMSEAYRAADVLVLPSESEGFGRVGFEAYQHGCFVVGRPENCFFDEVAPGGTAWATVDTFADLPAALARLVANMTDSHRDIDDMQNALSSETHVTRFLSIIRGEANDRPH